MPYIRIAHRLEHALDGSGARRRPEQACPPGSRLSITGKARRERLDTRRPTPDRNELLQPDVILSGLQGVRIVGRGTSLRQRAEQDEAGDTIRTIGRELDAGRSALGPAEQHDPAAASGIKHGADILRCCVDAGREPDPVGKAGPATIEQDETAHP